MQYKHQPYEQSYKMFNTYLHVLCGQLLRSHN